MTVPSRCMLSTAAVVILFFPACRKESKVFTDLDLDRNHRLTLSEIEAAVVTGLFNTYDGDYDGVITLAEWRKLDPAGDGNFMRQRDLNHDGRITREEAKTHAHRQGFCYDVLHQADRNGNGSLDRREAAVWVSDHPEVLARMNLAN